MKSARGAIHRYRYYYYYYYHYIWGYKYSSLKLRFVRVVVTDELQPSSACDKLGLYGNPALPFDALAIGRFTANRTSGSQVT
jgi:hypothetical protein